MGRPETRVDPQRGPVLAFAHDLRKLRGEAGNPTYRDLAEATHYCHSVLAEAARGDKLPTLAVTQAFVRACHGDEREWTKRWSQLAAQLHPPSPKEPVVAPAAPAEDSPTSEIHATDARPPGSRRAGLFRPPRVLLLGAVVLAVLVAVTVPLALKYPSSPSARGVAATTGLRVSPVRDGQDPHVAHCYPDKQMLDQRPIQWPDGTLYGQLELLYSPACAGIWGVIYGPNSPKWRVHIVAERPTDHSQSPYSFRAAQQPNSWGNVLSIRPGCVQVEGWVDTGTDRRPIRGPHAQTGCWQP